MTIDMSLINPCFEIESARIPDVKETIQSMRILAGESQRQYNANKQGTRKSIHDPDPNASWNISSPPLPQPTDYQLGSCDLVHAFHQMFVHEKDQYLTAFGNNVLGCWCWARGSQGTAGTPAAFYNFCYAALSKHGVLHSPDFDVSDLGVNLSISFCNGVLGWHRRHHLVVPAAGAPELLAARADVMVALPQRDQDGAAGRWHDHLLLDRVALQQLGLHGETP
jgi:hypothetical protein